MTNRQKLELRQSELREAVNKLFKVETRTKEQDGEIATMGDELIALDPLLRAAIVAEPDAVSVHTGVTHVDPETRERIELRSKATLGGFIAAALGGVLPSGAEHEYGAACGVAAGRIPVDLWEVDRPPETRAIETRAVTPSPGSGEGQTVAPIQPYVFSESIAPRIGVDMPSVGSGGYSEMTISTALTPAAEAKGDAADGTAAALRAVTATPRRISARLSISLEDVALVGTPTFESALRSHTSMVLSNQLDGQAINGDGSAPNVNGLINQLNDPTNPTAVATFDTFVESFAGAIDGLWAGKMTEIGIVTNVGAYRLAAQTFRGAAANGGPVETAASYLQKMTGGFWTNNRMPATSSTIARGIVYRLGRPGMRTACLPNWGSIGVDDIFSDSASGVRHFTLHVLVGSKILLIQPAAYGLVEYKVA